MSDAIEHKALVESTETVTVKEPLENMIATSESLRTSAESAQIAYEESLRAIAKAHGSTFTLNGQVHQIRHREDSKQGRPITYLCALKAEPKTWLTGRKKKATTTEETTPVASATALVVSEVGGATVIE